MSIGWLDRSRVVSLAHIAWLLLVGFGIGVPSAQAVFWSESFDELAIGSITNQPGWESVGGASSYAACSVSASRPYRGAHSLLVGVTSILSSQRLAVYEGLSHVSAVDQTRVRFSAWVQRDNRNQYFSMSLGTNGQARLTLGTTAGGNLRVNDADTGMLWPTGQYARVVLWYNMTSDEAALDVDGVRALDWTPVAANLTSFDEVRLLRTPRINPDSGSIYVDDLAVETYSSSTMAWYRFDETQGSRVEEFTGWVAPAPLLDPPSDAWRPPVWDLLVPYVHNLAENQGSCAGARIYDAPVRWGQGALTNWTAELLFFFPSDATDSFGIMTLRQPGTDGHEGPEIVLFWDDLGTNHNLRVFLRDDENISGEMFRQNVLTGRGDDQWHHLAVVKQSNILITYLDFRQVSIFQIGEGGDGTFTFDDSSKIDLGCRADSPFLGSWIKPSVVVDEFRFTGDILYPTSFLKTIAPRVGGVRLDSQNPLRMNLQCHGMPGRNYDIQYSFDLKLWIPWIESWVCEHPQTNVVVDVSPDPGQPIFWRLKDQGVVTY